MPGRCYRARVTPLDALGPYFAVAERGPDEPWRPLGDLLDQAVLAERIEHTATVLSGLARAEIEPRVAASTMALGLFSRIVSPGLGAVAVGLEAPVLTLDRGWWQPVESGPWPIAAERREPQLDPLTPAISGVVEPLVRAIGAIASLSEQVLWGNASSAVFGAVAMLRRTGADPAGRAARLALGALTDGVLRGAGSVTAGRFVRDSCCLYYRIPGGGYCGDCVLAAR